MNPLSCGAQNLSHGPLLAVQLERPGLRSEDRRRQPIFAYWKLREWISLRDTKLRSAL